MPRSFDIFFPCGGQSMLCISCLTPFGQVWYPVTLPDLGDFWVLAASG